MTVAGKKPASDTLNLDVYTLNLDVSPFVPQPLTWERTPHPPPSLHSRYYRENPETTQLDTASLRVRFAG